jgi:acyl-CoA reductase-like NAD-dependent aldehyde dehydrogenase
MNEEESKKLALIFSYNDGSSKVDVVGKSAQELAKRAGFSVSNNVKVLISKEKYVSKSNPYSKEKLCPVLTYYIEDDWRHACEKCIELLLSERQGHTLIIHSRDEEVIRQFALKKPVGRVLVNTPGALGSMGATTNLFPSMTLGSGSAGHGMTSDNVSPRNLIYIRKVGYGVRKADEIIMDKLIESTPLSKGNEVKESCNLDNVEFLEVLLKKVIENLK